MDYHNDNDFNAFFYLEEGAFIPGSYVAYR